MKWLHYDADTKRQEYVVCPQCGGDDTSRAGLSGGKMNYLCLVCGRLFTKPYPIINNSKMGITLDGKIA